jgi:hypothetical protein
MEKFKRPRAAFTPFPLPLFPFPSHLRGVRGKQSYDKTVGVAPD